jgi:hypothetical protein
VTRIRLWLATGLVLWLSLGIARAQDPPQQDPASGQPSASTEDAEDTPKADQGPRGFFGEAFGSHVSWGGDLSFRQEYDDNVFASSLFRFSDNISQFTGRLSLGKDGRRTKFQVHYSPNYRFYQKFDARNQFSQQFASQLNHRLTAFTTFTWDATLSDSSTSSGSPFGFAVIGPVVIPIFNPDGMQNDARIITGNTSFGLSHRFSARSTLRGSIRGGATTFLEKDGVPLPPGRSQEHFTVGGSVGWDYEFKPGRKFGVEASQDHFGFLSPSQHVNYQTIKLRYEQRFRNGLDLRLGAGPSLTERQSTGNNVDVSYAVDVSLIKSFRRSRVGGSFMRESRQSQFQDALSAYSANVFMNQEIGRRWLVLSSFSFSRSEGVGISGNLQSYAAQGKVGYQFRPELRAELGYTYVNQMGGQTLLIGNQFDRNLYSFGLTYSFGAAVRK